MPKLVFVIALFLGVFLLGCIHTNKPLDSNNQVIAPSGEQVADQPPSTGAGVDAGQNESDEDSSSQEPAPSSAPPSFPE